MHGWFFPPFWLVRLKGCVLVVDAWLYCAISLFWLLLHACKYMLCIPAVSGYRIAPVLLFWNSARILKQLHKWCSPHHLVSGMHI
jgi:hypothetical protein